MRLTPRGERVLVTVVLILSAAVVFAAFVVGQHLKRERVGLGPAQSITCEEDMPCWDCTTMGNRRCGP